LAAADAAAPAAPGTLASHYAPRARVYAVDPVQVPAQIAAARAGGASSIAVLAPVGAIAVWGDLGVLVRALPDDDAGMARELYAALRDLDAANVDVVIAALPPAAGLGEAVSDRLLRAAGTRE
jgi:L-threonylcarbamoyladenylate synthase